MLIPTLSLICINTEITYCWNYCQMYENVSEIAAHKKRLWSKVVVFFQSSVSFCFRKVVEASILQWIRYFLEEHLQSWIAFIQCKGALAAIHLSSNAIFQKTTCSYLVFSRLLCFFEIRIPVADIHSINDPFSIIKEQLQPRILVNLMCFCRTGIAARRVTSFTFSVVVSLLQGSTWSEIQKPKSATELVAITFVWEVLC